MGPAAVVFMAGLCVMTLEMAAGRMIARVLGQSLYSWTSVIGIVLAGLSLGNSLGGRLADRFAGRRLLSGVLVLSALLCFSVPALHQGMNHWPWLWDFTWPARVLLHLALVFFLPALMLGAVTPIAARAALAGAGPRGRVLGRLYAWNAIGSIVGTLLAGFWLIPLAGALKVAILVGGALGVMAVFFGGSLPSLRSAAWLLACALVGWAAFGPGAAAERAGQWLRMREPQEPAIVYRDESPYSYISVKAGGEPGIRGLYLDKMMHSEMDLRDPTRLLYKYTWIYEAVLDATSPTGRPVSAFVIGGGGYAFPQYLALTRPGSRVDVAEIDPAVTRAAREACGLRPDTPIRIHHLDARNFVADLLRKKEWAGRAGVPRRSPATTGRSPGLTRRHSGGLSQAALPAAIPTAPPYDYIFGDSINDYSVPYHLTTLEFTRQLDALMSDRGLYLLNMIDRFDSGRFLGAIVATFREVFPGVQVFFCHRNLAHRGTYVVIGSKRPLDPSDLSELSDRLRRHPDFFGFRLSDEQIGELMARTRARPLTDDHAPVENLLADVVRRDYPEGLDVHHLRQGLREAERGRLDRAVRRFERALEVNPANAQALYNLGVARMRRDEAEPALQAFAAAIQTDPDQVEARNNAGVLLAELGLLDEAAEQFEEIIRRRPENAEARVNLAAIRAQQGRPDEARTFLHEAMRLDPEHAQARQNLQALEHER